MYTRQSNTRRDFLKHSLLGAGALAMAGRRAASAPSRPNIVVIYTDDQGYGDCSFLNPEAKFQTPNLDRLAREGMYFTDGHCSDTVCSPSRYGLLTGRYSWRSSLKKGVLVAESTPLIPDTRMTLASFLRGQGYHTAMVGKWHLGMTFEGPMGQRTGKVLDGPVRKGFDYYYGIPASMNYGVLTYIENDRMTTLPSLWTQKKPGEAIADYRITPPYDTEKGDNDLEVAPDYDDKEVLEIFTKKACAWLESAGAGAHAGKPFFLYLPLTSPHKPVCPQARFVGKSDAGYYGDFMIETDYWIGEVMNKLEALGVAENTLVVISSDNGPENTYIERVKRYKHDSAGPLRGGKRDIWEGGHRVPFIMRWPDVIAPGRVCNDTVCQTDLLATFADILGATLPPDAGEDSYSLLPALRGPDYPHPLRGPQIGHAMSGHFAIREGDWKLIMPAKPGGPKELYNIVEDLAETRNVIAAHPEIAARLEARITEIVKNGRSTPGPVQANDGDAWWPQLTWMED